MRPLLAVEQLFESGAPLLWWRDAEQRVPLAALAARVPLSRIVLSARRRSASAGPAPAAGYHWGGSGWRTASSLQSLCAEPPLTGSTGMRPLLGASAHGLADLEIAARLRCDYATLSPIFATASKPGYGPALGLAALRDAAAQFPGLRVFALGGASLPRLPELAASGAYGVAALGAFACAQPGEVWRAWRDAWGDL